MSAGEDISTAAKLLSANGYLVFKIPACERAGRGHGRHVLVTRSAVCDGEEPMPHASAGFHMGAFGPWIRCACGREFRDYTAGDEDVTPWSAHKAEFIREVAP